uniref:RING-type domain-containing protein n=1 Tax=Aegilops tauschii subsp. strangulata TaxID=200361 RepID=A0A453G3C1_AEGTS
MQVYVDGDASISTIERRASLKEFYAIIYPYLQQIEENVMARDCKEKGWCKGHGDSGGRRKLYADDKDAEREDECGICLETCTKMVLPNCNHAMCINCYRDCWQIILVYQVLGVHKISVVPILPRKPEASPVQGPVGAHRRRRCDRPGDPGEGECEALPQLHRQPAPHRPGQPPACLL